MKYICINCNYLYDESIWDESEWILIWTTIDSMSNNLSCPSCWWYIENFQQIKEEILYLDNKNAISNLESLHIPKIAFLWNNKIMVSVWNIKHPMEQEHFISSIMLFDEYSDLIEERFLTYNEKLKVNFNIEDIDEFEIRIRCNLHWLWSTWIINNNYL